MGEAAVELAIPLGVRAEPHGQAVGEHLDDAAEGVAVGLRGVDLADHLGGGLGVEAAQRIRVQSGAVLGGRQRSVLGDPHGADGEGVGDEADACGLLEDRGGHAAGDHASGGLSRARALQDRTGLVQAVLEHAGEIGVTGTRTGQRAVPGDLALVAGAGIHQEVLAGHRIRAHDLLPLGPFRVRDLDRDRRAERAPVTEAAVDRQHVLLELLPAAAAMPEPPSGESRLQVVTGQLDPGGDAVEQGDEGRAMGFPGREPAQHGADSLMTTACTGWASVLHGRPPGILLTMRRSRTVDAHQESGRLPGGRDRQQCHPHRRPEPSSTAVPRTGSGTARSTSPSTSVTGRCRRGPTPSSTKFARSVASSGSSTCCTSSCSPNAG